MRRKQTQILARRITRALDPLRARLRKAEIGEAARRLAVNGTAIDATDLALALALIDGADADAAERRARLHALDRLGTALAAHGHAAADDLLRDHLRAAGASRADVRALERALDTDAITEREARTAGRLDGRREVCLAAAGTLASDAFAARRLDGVPPVPSPLCPERNLTERLLEHASDRGASWGARVAALEAIGRVWGAESWNAEAVVLDAVDALAADAGEHRWVQVAAVRALAAGDVARARVRARERITTPHDVPDDSIVRARLVRLLEDELADVEAAPALAAAAGDVSEHVRQSAARACRTSGDAICGEILARLSDPLHESSPRVRGVTAEVLAARARGDAGDAERLAAARGLARIVRTDPHPVPRRVASDAAATVCTDPDADAEVLLLLVDALTDARGADELSPEVANAVARAAERARVAIDPDRSRLREALASAVALLPEKGSTAVRLPVPADDAALGRALAELAQDDFGLYARRTGESVVLQRGEKTGRRAWRILHEVRHPIATKRQGFVHTVGRVVDAPLRAHAGGLAEVTRTRVPGERVFVPREGGWAPYLPLVDDLLASALAGGEPARLYSEHGCTVVKPPQGLAARVTARAELTRRYAELAAIRLNALEASDPDGRSVYADEVARLGFELVFEPHEGARSPRHVRELFPDKRTLPSLPLAGMLPFGLDPVTALLDSLGNRVGGGVPELAAFTAASAVLLAGRSAVTRAEVRACRKAVPLVIGGWGTRGKSGTERLKAALFHGLGYEVLVKTTGCEATVLVGVPGRPLVEVPLYRPYDKATIWEQRDVLRLAGERRPHVLLWECMALNPRYVDLLQRGWMRDDYATVTNAYPDHEDIQGPTGLDVARVIARFTPQGSTLVTAEDQMLPVLREQARSVGTRLVSVGTHEHDLLPQDLLDRFPYQEHPRNVALVLALAAELGIDRDVALVEMADHVLADIGGLRSYGPFPVEGRRVRFTNGMSANERASAVGNWKRLGLDTHDTDGEPGRWIVGFVNNRADRAARSLTFAEALVEDFAAHRFVLVGSNVTGLQRAIVKALARRLDRLRGAEVEGVLAQLKVGEADVASVRRELAAWVPVDMTDDAELSLTLETALSPMPGETLASAEKAVKLTGALARIETLLAQAGIATTTAADVARFAATSIARRRVGRLARLHPESPDTKKILADLFLAQIVIPPDPLGDPDDLISFVAASCPPGVSVDVMGLQNIKGPGLAVVYRFADMEHAVADVATLSTGSPEARLATLRRLRDLDAVGRHVLGLAADGVSEAAANASTDDRPPLVELARVLSSRRGLTRGARNAPAGLVRGWSWLRRTVDHVPSVGRRRMADSIFDDLATGRVAASRAARDLEKLLSEQRR